MQNVERWKLNKSATISIPYSISLFILFSHSPCKFEKIQIPKKVRRHMSITAKFAELDIFRPNFERKNDLRREMFNPAKFCRHTLLPTLFHRGRFSSYLYTIYTRAATWKAIQYLLSLLFLSLLLSVYIRVCLFDPFLTCNLQ